MLKHILVGTIVSLGHLNALVPISTEEFMQISKPDANRNF